MFNIGEEIVAAYLRCIEGCDFVQKNLPTPDEQGEIDVIGINLKKKILYVCEVTIHLVTGMNYTKNSKNNNVPKLIDKFERSIHYANSYFSDYTKRFQFWSPIVKQAKEGSKRNQMKDLEEVKSHFQREREIDIELIINTEFSDRFEKLRNYASQQNKALNSPVLRLLQIEEHLEKFIKKHKEDFSPDG